MATIEIDELGGQCPVQAEGLINGEPFYFRARWSMWEIYLGSEVKISDHKLGVRGMDVIGNPKWYYTEEYGEGPFDAGWMEHDTAREFIEQAAEMFEKDNQ